MPPLVLIIITSDPRTSGRPAEAIRIAAGVGTWRKAAIRVYLRGPAVLALSDMPDDFVEEDNYVRYLPILKDFALPILVEANAPLLKEVGEAILPFEEISTTQLAEMAADATYVLRF